MKKRAKLYLIALSCASLALFVVLSLFVINRQAMNASRRTLESYLSSTITLAELPANPQDFVSTLSGGFGSDVRITLLDRNGNVLGDSHASPATMPNHLDREEIAGAVAGGTGEALRASDTTGVSTLYAARLWQQDYILRFAMPVAAAREFANSMIPVILFTLLVICVIITVVVDRFAGRLSAPYEKMLVYIETMLQNGRKDNEISFTAEYDEMLPIIRYFHYLLDQIEDHISQITEKSAEVENIMSNMQEGLVLLDEEMNIVSINPQATRFLAIPQNSWQKRITFLFRNEVFVAAVLSALETREHQMVDVETNDRVCRFYINPVPDNGFVMLISDVTDIVRLERMRSDFAANVSHELKTPLTSISGFAELIETGMVDNVETMRDYAGKIHTESLRLVRLIDDILHLSSIENTSGPEEQQEPVDVYDIFTYVLELLGTQMQQRQITVEIQGDLKLRASREHLHELALNLCDNAVKYNREGGKVLVTLSEKGFSVTDTGIGIPPEHQSRVFERFYRVDKARSRKTGGTGLGLSIVKHVAALYGANVSIESSGKGTCFTVAFPSRLVVK